MPTAKVVLGALAVMVMVAGSVAHAEGEATFIGLKKCAMCHKKDAGGNQLAKWKDGAHSGAYETLASEEALAVAKELGLGNPQEAPECLRCHVTAFSVMGDLENQKITLEEGVSCESCHGAGSKYYKKKTMQAITDGEVDGATLGLVMPDEAVCKECHNPESPSYREFEFATMFEKIAHPIPEAPADAEVDEE